MNGGFLLDTNILSELARPRVEAKVEGWLAEQKFGIIHQRRDFGRVGERLHHEVRPAKAGTFGKFSGTEVS